MAGRKDVFQKAMNQGHSAAWDQNWEQAASCYRQALQEFPEHPGALTNLGLALYQQGSYEAALQTYIQAARAKPDDPIPMEKISELYERLGGLERACDASLRAAELYARGREVEKAIECWIRVTRLNPEHLLAHQRLALVYEKLNQKQQAVTEYLAVASLYQHGKDLPRAVQTLQHALQVAPGSQPVVQALQMIKANRLLPKPLRPRGGTGPLRMAQVKQLEAPAPGAVYSDANLDPVAEARQLALTQLAAMLFEQGEDSEREPSNSPGLQAIVKGATGRAPGRQVDMARVNLHLSQVVDFQTRGQEKDAAMELERAIGQGLEHPAAYFDLGLLQFNLNRPDGALRSLKKATSSEEYGLAAYLLMGQTHHKAGALKEAAVAYLEALKIADGRVVTPAQSAELRQLYDPLIEAQALQDNPEANTRLCTNVAEMLLKAGWRDRLLQARRQLPKQAPTDPPMPIAEIIAAASSGQVVESITRIQALASEGRWRTAMEEAYWAIQHAPTYLPLHTYIADLLVQQGFTREAIDKYGVVARAYAMRGEAQRAVDLLRRIIELAPLDLGARNQLIDQLVAQRKPDIAIQEYLNLASVYYSRAELDKARRTYTEALRLTQQPNVTPALKLKVLHQMADIDLQSLDWRQALRVFEQIRTLDPGDEKARHYLTTLYLRLGQQPQALVEMDSYLAHLLERRQASKAVAFLESMLKDSPDVLPFRHRLAELYRQAGKNEAAIQQLDAITQALLTQGDRPGAAKTLRAILKLNPPDPAPYERLLQRLGT